MLYLAFAKKMKPPRVELPPCLEGEKEGVLKKSERNALGVRKRKANEKSERIRMGEVDALC